VDGFVLLSPLVVLAVILLLGYTGCQSLFGLDEVTLPGTLTFEARVPAAFTIVASRFTWTRPGSTEKQSMPNPVSTPEGDLVLLSHTVSDVETGMWEVSCRLTVRVGAAEQEDVAQVDFMVQSMPGPLGVVRFETKGSPVTPDFKVVPVGFEPV
jgi:hypothetical protein